MSGAGYFDSDTTSGRHAPPGQAGVTESGGRSDSCELADQVGEAAAVLGAKLGDPGTLHAIEEIAAVTSSLSTAVGSLADGLHGVTQWLRTSGHGGVLSGQASAVADRLGHAGSEIHRLAEAIGWEGQRAN